jgi:gas vesicle protein GvpA/GvpJ/GvpM family
MTETPGRQSAPARLTRGHLPVQHGASLADLLDRVVQRGVVVSGEVIIQLADIDLIRVDLRLLLAGIHADNDNLTRGTGR